MAEGDIVQGAGNWVGYVGPGAENLTNQNRVAAIQSAGNQAILASQIPTATYDPRQDAINEAAKHAAAFSQPRDDTMVPRSEAFNAIVAQYQIQHYANVGSSGTTYNPEYRNTENIVWDTSTAAGIAQMLAGSGGGVSNPYLASVARAEGYAGPLSVPVLPSGEIDLGRNIVPIREIAVTMPDSSRINMGGSTVTTFVPYGEYTQIRLEGTKNLIDYNTGELGIYQRPTGHSIYNLAGGGGRNALQSGMFTVNYPETPYVIEQSDVSEYILPSGEGLSRLGAEAYGGFVMPLDNRTLGTAQLSTYENPANLANYVNPQGPNLSKAEAPGANLPWQISANAPAIQYVDERGIIPNSAVFIPGANVFVPENQVKGTGPEIVNVPGTSPEKITSTIDGREYTFSIQGVIGSNPDYISVVPGSTKITTTETQASPSIENFLSNLGGNISNTLFGTSFETRAGFGKTITEITRDVQLPAPYVSNAPVSYESLPITFRQSETITNIEPSIYDVINTSLSAPIPKLPVELTTQASAGKIDYLSSAIIGGYEAASERPLDIIKMASVGAIYVVGAEALTGISLAATQGTRAAAIIEPTITTLIPAALGAFYATNVAERATAGFSDLSPSASYRLGGIASTETIPLLAGGFVAARPEIAINAGERSASFVEQVFTPDPTRYPQGYRLPEGYEPAVIVTSTDLMAKKTIILPESFTSIKESVVNPEIIKSGSAKDLSPNIEPYIILGDTRVPLSELKLAAPETPKFVEEIQIDPFLQTKVTGRSGPTFFEERTISEYMRGGTGTPDISNQPRLQERPAPFTQSKFITDELTGERFIRVDNKITGESHYELDTAPLPMDLLPGTQEIKLASPAESYAPIKLEGSGISIEPLRPEGNIPSQFRSGPISQQMLESVANPEITSATRSSYRTNLDTAIETGIIESKIQPAVRLSEEQQIVPSINEFESTVKINSAQFEDILMSIVESEKRTSVETIREPRISQIAEETSPIEIINPAIERYRPVKDIQQIFIESPAVAEISKSATFESAFEISNQAYSPVSISAKDINNMILPGSLQDIATQSVQIQDRATNLISEEVNTQRQREILISISDQMVGPVEKTRQEPIIPYIPVPTIPSIPQTIETLPNPPVNPPPSPYVPMPPVPPFIPPVFPPIFRIPDFFGQGGGGGYRRGKKSYMEYFPVGLDISTFGLSPESNPFENSAGSKRYRKIERNPFGL